MTGFRRVIRAVGVVLLAALSVVFLGSEASAAPPDTATIFYSNGSPPVTSKYVSGGVGSSQVTLYRARANQTSPTPSPNQIPLRVQWYCSNAPTTLVTNSTSGLYANGTAGNISSSTCSSGNTVTGWRYQYENAPGSGNWFTFYSAQTDTFLADGSLAEESPMSDTCSAGTIGPVYVGYDASLSNIRLWYQWTGHRTNYYFKFKNAGGQTTGLPDSWVDGSDYAKATFSWPGSTVGSTWTLLMTTTSGDATGCKVTGTIAAGFPGNPTLAGGGSGGTEYPDSGATDPIDDSDCGAWYDIACQFRSALHWAFVPDPETLDALGGSWAEAEESFPISIIAASWDLSGSFIPPYCEVACYFPDVSMAGEDILTADSPGMAWMDDNRELVRALFNLLVFGPLFVAVAWKLVPVVGDRGTT